MDKNEKQKVLDDAKSRVAKVRDLIKETLDALPKKIESMRELAKASPWQPIFTIGLPSSIIRNERRARL